MLPLYVKSKEEDFMNPEMMLPSLFLYDISRYDKLNKIELITSKIFS